MGGLTAEYVPIGGAAGFAYEWFGPTHYLALHDLNLSDGETFADAEPVNRRLDLRGTVTFVPAKTRIWGWSVPRSAHQSFTALYMDPRRMEEELGERINAIPSRPLVYFANSPLRSTFEKIRTALTLSQPHETLHIESLCLVALFELSLSHRHDAMTTAQIPGRLAPSKEAAISEYVDSHLDKDISLNELAGLAGMSRFHFVRTFKRTTQESPYQYLLRRRIERAESLLRSSEGSIADIAAAVGFKTAAQLTRMFRRFRGITPGAYRG